MPMTGEFGGESAVVIMPDGNAVKVFFEDLCLHPLMGTDLNLGQISFFALLFPSQNQ